MSQVARLDGEWVFRAHSPPLFVTEPVEPVTASDDLDEEWIPFQWPLSAVATPVVEPVGAKRKIDFDNRPCVLAKLTHSQRKAVPPHMVHQQAKKRAKHLPPLHSGCIPPGTYILQF